MRSSLPAISLLGLIALVSVATASASDTWLSFDGSTAPRGPEVEVLADTPDLVHLRVAVPGIAAQDRETPDGMDTQLMIPGHGHTLAIGEPSIPMVNLIVEIPLGAGCEAEALAGGLHRYTLGTDGLQPRLYPTQPSQRKTDERDALEGFQRDLAAYQMPGLHPDQLVSIQEMGEMRSYRLLLVQVRPVASDPVSGELICHDQIDVMIRLSGADIAATRARLERYYSPSFDQLLARHAVNHHSFLGGMREFPVMPIGLLIISADALAPAVDLLADWKTRKGYYTTVATLSETGSGVTQIEDYITNAYNNWEVPPTWVLLVGDTDTVPYRTGSACGSATDLYYATITGGDYLPEVHVGRFPGRTISEITAMVDKIVDSEMLNLENGVDFMNTATWIASSDMGAFAEGTHEYCISHWFDPAGIYSIRIYERLGGSTQDIRDAINGGTLMANYSGHGSTDMWNCVPFTQNDIRNLYNTDMYPFIISNACLTGNYASTECFGETWLRVGGAGGIGHFGCSTYTYWDEDDILEKEMWRHFWEEDDYTLGQMCDGGLLGVYTYYGGGGRSRYYFEGYNVLGDPSYDLWATYPEETEVTHLPTFFIGMDQFEVSVQTGGSAGEDRFLVCLYMPGQVYETAYTDTSGQAIISVDPTPTQPGTMHVTVTRHDNYPYFGSVEVLPAAGPYLVFDSYAIDDDQGGESLGNGDGDADFGECVEIPVTLENVGVETAINVSADLRSDDPYIAILDNTEDYGDIPPGDLCVCFDDFDVRIAGVCPDGHTIHFDLDIHADDRMLWETGFNVTVEAPALAISRVVLDDTAGGDGNGRADPGENCTYRVFLTNAGSEDATAVSAQLFSTNEMVAVTQATAGAPLIAAGAEVELTPAYAMTISPDCPDPEIVTLWLSCGADWGYLCSLDQELAIGGFWDDIEGGEGGWTHYAGSGSFVDQWHRSSEKNYTPGGLWSWKQGSTGTGDYANLCDGCLVTEPISLSEMTSLRFMHWMEAEVSQMYQGYCYDGGLVEVSINGGPWEQITPEGGYPYLIRTGGTPGPFPAETPVYSGAFDWTDALFVLEGYAGTAQFRFRFGSDGATTDEGWYIDDVEVTGTGGGAQAADDWERVALRPLLMQNAPNPFRPATMVAFELPRAQEISLQVFDAGGRLVRTLADGRREAGLYRVSWDGTSDRGRAMPAGVYYYRLETDEGMLTRSMTLLR